MPDMGFWFFMFAFVGSGLVLGMLIGSHLAFKAMRNRDVTVDDIAAAAYRNFYGRPWSEATDQARAELREIAADALQGGR